MEGDSEIITTALKDEHLPLLYSHIRREGNMVAHNLARYTRNVSDYVVWIKDAPPHIHNVIQADSAFFFINIIPVLILKKKKMLRWFDSFNQCIST